MTQAFSTNPMERGLQTKQLYEEKKTVNSVSDHRGDTWKRRDDLVRNKTHPSYWKDPITIKDHKVTENMNRCNGWHNQRTGEVHEGGIRVHAGGTASLGDSEMGVNPRYFHISHYDIKKPEKK